MWPLHTWLPDAHTEAPTGGSVVLAALMLKLGAYGFFRFSLPIVPDACHYFMWLMIVLSLISVIYVGMVALVQSDMKKLIAYSSISHKGFVTLGCFVAILVLQVSTDTADAFMSLEGALTQMISHAFGRRYALGWCSWSNEIVILKILAGLLLRCHTLLRFLCCLLCQTSGCQALLDLSANG